MPQYDIVVVGLGAMGSAALLHLARRRARVLGIERYAPGHDRGSSHGLSRIIRLAYFEHPSYVPLLRRAYALWRELEIESGRELLQVTGILEIGPPDGELVVGTLASATFHSLRHEVLAAADLMRRFPVYRLPEHYVGVLQSDGGWLAPEASVNACVDLARKLGAEMWTGVNVRALEPHGDIVRLLTDRGTVEAKTAIVAIGPWLKSLLPQLPAALRVTRQVLAWFKPIEPVQFAPDRFPVFLMESRHGMHYGFPADREGRVKVAKHHHRDEVVEPDSYDRTVSAVDENVIRAALADHLPAANGALAAAQTCLYTVMPDGDFLIDRLPGFPQLIIASPCSGHGFKFAPVIGEILADLAIDGTTVHDISRFRLSRGT